MATRKKKTEELSQNVTWPKINQGSHLTVKTFEDGRTELIWDDDALLRDVRDAILRHESNIPATAEATSKPKKKDVQKALTEDKNTVKVSTTATKVKKTKK
jgi:hypothetical protein